MAGNDFTRRLRTAIKAKIQELGMEVDDELPDYIMIMIANKKDRTRMKTDLALFLGDHTDVFVDWMFDFFEKVNKKEAEDKAKDEPPRIVEAASSSSATARRSRSRSPLARSKSPKRSSRYDEDVKPKRAPIRAPSPKRERDSRSSRRRRSRSRSPRRSREERRKVTYDSDDEDDRKAVRSHVVAKNRHEREASPKLSSQVIIKRKKPDLADVKGSSTLFKRAIDATVEDESPSKQIRKRHRDFDNGVLQVNTARSLRRVIPAEEEPEETRFLVRVGDGPSRRFLTDDGPPGDENFAAIKRRRRLDNPVRAFLQLSGVRKALDATVGDYEDIIIRKRRGPAHTNAISNQWDGKIEIDDEEDDSDDNEAEIDAFLATAHDSRIPPTEIMSRPIYAVPPKRAFNKAAAVEAGVAGKSAEKCRFWPNCRNEGSCPFAHPSKPCLAFPNCWFGDKCHFVHPRCKYEPNCTKPQCPYVHTAPRSVVPRHATFPKPSHPFTAGAEGDAVGTAAIPPTSAAEQVTDGAASTENTTSETVVNDTSATQPEQPEVAMDAEAAPATQEEGGAPAAPKPDVMLAPVVPNAPPIRPLSTAAMASIMCRFGARCHNEGCGYRHPKKCRYDEVCTNEQCYFWHPKKNAGRFRWVKT